VDVRSNAFLWVKFLGDSGVSGQFKTWCVRYPLWTAYADTDYRNKTSLVSIYFHIPHNSEISKNQESESLAQSFHAASWVYFEF